MPLFHRADAVPVDALATDRRMMPHLSWGRNASAVHHRMVLDVTGTRRWLADQRRRRPAVRAGLLHLFLWACAGALQRHPPLNRFVSGGRLYQRHRIVLALSVRPTRGHDISLTTLKLDATHPEPFPEFAERLQQAICTARTADNGVDRQLRLAARLPHPLVRLTLTGYRLLDRFNLLPVSAQADDPSFTSLFVSNLGSIGLDDTFHHLFELGTNSVFACLGRVRRHAVGGREHRSITVNWTIDERIADGTSCARALKDVAQLLENPAKKLAVPTTSLPVGRRTGT